MAYDSKGTLNKVMLIGRLGKDPELKYTGGGTAVADLSVATNMAYKKEDETFESTEWHRVVVWRKLAEIVERYAKKGDRIYIEGRLITRSWEDNNGVKRYSVEIVADTAQLLSSKNNNHTAEGTEQTSNPNGQPPLPSEPPMGVGGQDDLPF